jgi:acyl-CoA thioester hydrolase
LSHVVRIQIRWRDIDAYQHMNNAVYLNYLEEARDRLVSDLFGAKASWDFVLVHVDIDFRSEITLDDGEVDVSCGIASIGRASVRTKEEIRKADGKLAAEAASVVVPRDPATGRARPLTEEERSVLQAEIDRSSR